MVTAGGFSSVRLARLGAVLAGYVARGEIAGVVAVVCRRGEEHVEVQGRRMLGGEPMQRDMIFRISSMTKPITAAAAMMLIEECRLRLDEPVDRLLPELANRRVLRQINGPIDDTVPAQRPITTRDLLTFRAGYGLLMNFAEPYPIQQALAAASLAIGPEHAALSPDEFIRRLGELPLMYQPGERWLYSGGTDILAILIARAAGMPFEQFLRVRIFGPLGMTDTGFSVPEAKLARLTGAYQVDSTSGQLVPYDATQFGGIGPAAAAPGGSTGLFSTVDDYLAFGSMLLNQGRHGAERLLSRPSVMAMTTDQLTPEQKARSPFFPGFWDSRGWGFGVSVGTRRTDLFEAPGRFGWDGGLGTSWYADPREELQGIVLTQRLGPPVAPSVLTDFWTLAYQAIDD